MKKVIALTLIFILSAGLVFGQQLRTKDKAILFTFSGLSNLGAGSYMGGIGAKLYMGNMAIRPTLLFGSASTEDSPVFDPANIGAKESVFGLGVGLDLLIPLSEGRISPYVGVGGGFEIGKYTAEAEHSQTDLPDKNEESETVFGFKALLGAEVFIVRNLSLGAEYQLGYRHLSETDTFTQGATGSKTEAESSGSAFGVASAGMVILNIYF